MTSELYLIDVSNQFRVDMETDNSGLPLRNAFERAYFSRRTEIYVCDGKNSRAMRKAIYPEYKDGRKRAEDNFYIQLGMYVELLHHTDKMIVKPPEGWEADDFINYIALTSTAERVIVESTDRDFCGIQSHKVETPKANLKKVERADVRLYKTLVGDTSDNIKGVKNFGDKSFLALSDYHKVNWAEALTKEKLPDRLDVHLGLDSDKLMAWVGSNFPLLVAYWKVIGFFPVTDVMFGQSVCIGKADYPLADSKLKDTLQ
jgi:hypothetical protein